MGAVANSLITLRNVEYKPGHEAILIKIKTSEGSYLIIEDCKLYVNVFLSSMFYLESNAMFDIIGSEFYSNPGAA